ncbi:hypothetical protein PYW07_009443 [Mythimna separata]|uniref:Uncharacterized protein n=1 Tax=Mythimna separata TaxID=271217 RepID=A0AAD8DNA9_MYTSE|nr:hypothetical protein PYW07_009443 [Mythimna separata]
MDISYDNEVAKQCYKCDQTVLSNLNIVCNASNKTVILWNQFQIFVYENLEFETTVLTLLPTFQVNSLLIAGNYLVCLDCSGNIHTTSLKLKTTGPKSLKYSFQPRELSIVASTLYDVDNALCLKYEADSYFLCLHKINNEFSLVKNVILIYEEHLPLIQTQDKCILTVHPLPENLVENLKKVFKSEDLNIRNKHSLIIVTFDKINVYGCLFSSKMTEEHVPLVKLYSCPSEISSIQVIESGELNILIGLNIGTIVRLSLKDLDTPQIIHLNIAIHKLLTYKDAIIYTDGKSMWKAENLISKDIKFNQFFVKHVKDFNRIGGQIICTTFMDLIYKFSLDDAGSYLKQESTEEYFSAEKLLNNTEYLQKIMDEVKKNAILIKTLTKEKDYITALSLSNRQDIMDSIINHKVIVYENYEDAITENSKAILTDEFSKYFDKESFFFLIKITSTSEHKLSNILSNSLGDLKVHLTLATSSKIIRTTSIKVTDLKKISFLIPLKNTELDFTEMNVHTKIMSNIPGALDTKQKIWTTLYRKHVTLHSEHFITFNLNLNRQLCLKNMDEPLEKLILQTEVNQYGNLFEFDDASQKSVSKEWKMFVRLPENYEEVFRKKDLTKHLTSKKVNYFLQQFTSEEFLKSKSNLIFSIGSEKVKIEIYNDSFSSPLLKLSSSNIKIVLNIRNFLSDLIYCVFANFAPGKEFINLSSYATVENLQKAVRKCITGSSEEDMEPLIEQFERNVIGVLPI